MKRLILTLPALFLIISAFLLTPVDEEMVYQISRMDLLMAGAFDGKVTYGSLKKHGDFGLGTFDALDGEMICLDGQFYQVKTDGAAYPVKGGMKTPFANITFFQADQVEIIDQPIALNELQAYLAARLPDPDGFYAIRIDAQFDQVRTRSVAPQQKPYPPLAEAIDRQVIFDFEEIDGTMVGFYFPPATAGESVAGFHFHFLTVARDAGGHLLDCRIRRGTLSIDRSSGMERMGN